MPATVNRLRVLTYAEAEALLGSRQRVRVAHNTYLHSRFDRDGTHAYALQLHNTDVVTIRDDGTYRLNSGGWRTATTKQRINALSPARVYQHRGEWLIANPTFDEIPFEIPFEDGILVDGNGQPLLG